MALTKKQHRRGGNFNNLDITNVKSIQVNQDASNPDELVRKQQAEQIAQSTVEGNLVTSSASASLTTAFTSQSMVSFLQAKQDNMSIDASSTAYLEIVDGTKIKVKQLLSQDVNVDDVSNDLTSWLASNPSNTLEEGDILILTSATINQQRSWIHNGGNAGDESDFTQLITDYNEASIRAMFSSASSFVIYDNGSGQFSLNMGTSVDKLGGQTIPVDSNEFSVVNGTTVLAVLKALETYISQVDSSAGSGTATLNTRLDSLVGVSGNNMGAFNDTAFPSNATIKQVLEASLVKHLFADNDRAAMRAVRNSQVAGLQANIDAEIARATAAEASEATSREASDSTLQSAINANSSLIISESQTRFMQDSLLQQRLNVIEGDNNTEGSVAKALSDANSFTVSQVNNEAQARIAADNALNLKIDNLAEGDITFVGIIQGNTSLAIRADRISAGDTRNGQFITNVDLKAGETFVIGAATDIAYPDAVGGLTTYEKGDKLMITEDVSAGSLLEANVNAVPANQTGLSIENVTGSPTIEMSINDELDVKDDSISRDHLVQSIEDDIDDKRSLTQNNAVTSNSDTHFVTDVTTGTAQNVYFKRTSNTSSVLSGTKRTILGELHVSSNGSSNPTSPNYAHTAT